MNKTNIRTRVLLAVLQELSFMRESRHVFTQHSEQLYFHFLSFHTVPMLTSQPGFYCIYYMPRQKDK